MDFWKFLANANASFLVIKEDVRYGQHLVNELSRIRPELERIVPMDLDPFYDNQKVEPWMHFLIENWEIKS